MALLSVCTASPSRVMLLTFPSAVQGIIQSDLNYSVILECLASYITPTPVLHWTLDGEPYDTGNMLIIRRLSWGHLGTYVCTAKNSQGEYPSNPVTISLPRESPPHPHPRLLHPCWSVASCPGSLEPTTEQSTRRPFVAKVSSCPPILPGRVGIISPFYRRKR